MDSLKSSFENLTGMLSVGSLCLLGVFLFLDGRTDILPCSRDLRKVNRMGHRRGNTDARRQLGCGRFAVSCTDAYAEPNPLAVSA